MTKTEAKQINIARELLKRYPASVCHKHLKNLVRLFIDLQYYKRRGTHPCDVLKAQLFERIKQECVDMYQIEQASEANNKNVVRVDFKNKCIA